MKKLGSVIDVLQSAKKLGVHIYIENGELQLKYAKGKAIDQQLLEDIRANKDLIIRFLKDNDSKTDSDIDDNNELELFRNARETIEKIPLSYSQERLWFIDRLESSTHYHIPAVLRLKGKLNIEALEYSLRSIVERHEVLRTIFIEEDGKVYQEIEDPKERYLNLTDGTGLSDSPEELYQLTKKLINKQFDLSNDHMIRADLINLGKDENVLVVTMHHIASDGWSLPILVKEVMEYYRSFESKSDPELEPLQIQYADYAIRQRQYLSGEVLDKKLDYWKEKLKGAESLQLPTDFRRPAIQSIKGNFYNFSIEKTVADKLKEISNKNGTTLFMTMLAAFKLLLQRYSGQKDICVGTVVAGRQSEALNGLIGFFVNTLALRTETNSEDTFIELLQKVKRTTIEAQEHQDVPFEKVVDAIVKERSLSRSPLFQTMFLLQNIPEAEKLKLSELQITREEYIPDTAKFELTFRISESAAGLNGSVEYCTDLFKQDTIERMVTHYKELLNSIVKEPNRKISLLPIISEKEKQQLLTEFNDISESEPIRDIFTDLFEIQAEKTPDNIALVYKQNEITYKKLNERSNQFGHYLTRKGVKEEQLIPVCMDRSIDMFVVILGILKAGGAYVPVDPEFPDERVLFILKDTGASIFISEKAEKLKLPDDMNVEFVNPEKELPEIEKESIENLQTEINPEQTAYVIYTSGSTGKPKGVMVGHNNIVSYLLNNKTRYISEKTTDSGSFIHLSFTFDASITGMFMPLVFGKSVVIGSEKALDIFEDDNLLKHAPYDFIKLTPAHIGLIQHKIRNDRGELLTKKLVAGGEALQQSQLNYFKDNRIDVNIINEYGPTEATVGCSVYGFSTLGNDVAGEIPIGKPIDNVRMYILDENKELVPVGVAGEIYVGGPGIAKGYLNKPELTEEKFIKDPFSEKEGTRLYRTGDLGRWMSDGNIEFIGRADEQVKIGGYRVELGEIENVLNECNMVRQSVVLAKDIAGIKRLIGYVVPEGDFKKQEIIKYLSSRLPEYMIPSLWVELEKLPITSNGKVDKKALPDADVSKDFKTEYIAPRNETEKILAEIWKELLRADRVGINDNFFELGGDSIITIQVLSRARKFGIELKPKDIFLYQTVGKLSAAISDRADAAVTGEQGMLQGRAGLLPIQQWFFENISEDERKFISHFNQSVLLKADKAVTPEMLGLAVQNLMLHHDGLRTRIYKISEITKINSVDEIDKIEDKDQWIQEYGTNTGKLEIVDLRSLKLNKDHFNNQIKEHAEKYQSSLDIEKGEIVRFILIQTPKEESHNRILIIVHHLAVDGVSWRIISDDLELLLSGQLKNEKSDLGLKGSSYRQWYDALKKYGQSKRAVSQVRYWENIVSNFTPLKTDKEYNGKVKVKDMSTLSFKLDETKTQSLLRNVSGAYHTEINDMLLSALALTLGKNSSTGKIVIGLEGHGRENMFEGIDINRTVGWFTSMCPVLMEFTEGSELSDLIKGTKENLRRIPDKGLGFGVLKYLNKDEILKGKSCWDIVFNYLGQFDNSNESGKILSSAKESKGNDISEELSVNEKLIINGSIHEGKLTLRWSYSSLHFEKETIDNLIEEYRTNLELLISHCTEQKKAGSAYTPSDYGLTADVNYTELDKFLGEINKVKERSQSISGLYRLSGLQQGMLFHSLYDPGSGAYIEQFSCDLINPDLSIIKKSWDQVLANHSILRSGFFHDAFSIPVQCVFNEAEIPVTVLDYRELGEDEQQLAIQKYEQEDSMKGFDLKSAPLMRIALIRLNDERYRMLWTSHHILFDGWSLQILIEEFLKTYQNIISDKMPEKKETDLYEDYIRHTERSDIGRQEAYWKDYMEGVEHSTLMPFVEKTNSRNKGEGVFKKVYLNLDEEMALRVNRYAQKERITVNTIMQGVWSYLLHRYTGSKNVSYGVVVSGRPDELPGIESRVGLYINTLPLHSKLIREEKISEWLVELQKSQSLSSQFQHTPLQKIQEWAGIAGDLFDTIMVFENYPLSEIVRKNEWSLQVENIQMNEQSNYPFSIIISSSDQISIGFIYNAELIRKEYVNNIHRHFKNVLLQIINNEELIINEIEILTEPERDRLLAEFNDTAADFPLDKTVIELFEEQVKKFPDETALEFENKKLTYKELNDRSNQLASYLQNMGVKPETLVPLCIERSLEMIIGIFGILKAGGAFVPIDPDYPEERINFMLKDTGADLVLSSKLLSQKLESSGVSEIIEIDSNWSEISKNPATDLKPKIKTDKLAYVIYTSGSTGKPKGAEIEHAGLVNLTCSQIRELRIKPGTKVLQFSSIGFDASVYEIFPTLIGGGKLIIPRKEDLLSVKFVTDLIENGEVDLITLPTSYQLLIKDKIKNLGTLVSAGEAMNYTLAKEIQSSGVRLINAYGPTENTVCVTMTDDPISEDGNITIGKPTPNMKIYILDKDLNLVPEGVAGELCTCGIQLARGYLNQPELTDKKFIKNPFRNDKHDRLYMTGDLARWLPDGNIEYLGRTDEQLKIRGFRIEPGEIESVIQELESVKHAVVTAKQTSDGSKKLVGYIVPKGTFDKDAIMLYLCSRLPEYMVPDLWVELEYIPVTSSGKTDKKALPDPDIKDLFKEKYVAPRTEIEKKLADIWKDILKTEKVGVYDNFFEIGGHSLSAMRVISAIIKEFEIELAVKDLFNYTNINDLSKYLEIHTNIYSEEKDSNEFEQIYI